MRHVSRTQRVRLSWLYDNINLDPMILIKYVDTTQQLAKLAVLWRVRVVFRTCLTHCSICFMNAVT